MWITIRVRFSTSRERFRVMRASGWTVENTAWYRLAMKYARKLLANTT